LLHPGSLFYRDAKKQKLVDTKAETRSQTKAKALQVDPDPSATIVTPTDTTMDSKPKLSVNIKLHTSSFLTKPPTSTPFPTRQPTLGPATVSSVPVQTTPAVPTTPLPYIHFLQQPDSQAKH
jgi:hypothetical protein